MEDSIKEIIRTNGEDFSIKRGEITLTVKGLINKGKRHITFFPNMDVRAGDVLINNVSQREYNIVDVDKNTDRIIAKFEAEL